VINLVIAGQKLKIGSSPDDAIENRASKESPAPDLPVELPLKSKI
jgi:hypothetical protein